MNVFDIPVTAIRAAQQGMHTVSSNLANASTPGYHLQRARLAETQPVIDGNFRIGAGVAVSSIDRMRSAWVEQSLLRTVSNSGQSSARLEAAQQLDTLFNPTDNSVHARSQKFFEAWQDLSAQPADATLRRDLVAAADGLASEINALHDGLTALSRDFDTQIRETVKQINALVKDIAKLNTDIQVAEAAGTSAHSLSDQRDQLVSKLSELIDVDSMERVGQPHAFSVANGAMMIGTTAPEVSVDTSTGRYLLSFNGLPSPLPAAGGRLAGLIEAHDELIAEAKADLETWSSQLVRSVDQLHAQGLGLSGPFTNLSSERGIADATAPLAGVDDAFPIRDGKLTITMTDEATGVRTVHAIDVEPGLDSLNDIAARISGIPHLSAEVSATSGRLTLIAEQGHAFEFTGRMASEADLSNWTGTSQVSIGGNYSGTANSDWTIEMIGSGQIGVTPDLRAQVRDSSGSVVGVFSVGLGYVAGSELTTSQGVTLKFSEGTVVSSETAGLRVTANADETGLLSALGMNSMFTGDRAGSFSVRDSLLRDPGQLAVARSDRSGDNTNGTSFAALGAQRFSSMDGLTFGEYLGQMTANVGSHVQTEQAATDQFAQIQLDLEAQRQSVSGVDPNEELVKLLEYQRMFQSAAKFISTVNQAIDDLFSMMR